jgi:general secretion pathway protein F
MLASIAGVLAALAFLAVLGLRRRVTAVDLLSGLPWVRGHARAFEMSRLYMTTGLLLSGGIPLVRALRLVEPTLRNESRARLGAAARNIASGVSFSDAMASERLTDPVSLRLFRVGEQTGDLGGVLLRAARYLDGEVTRFIDRFTRVAEPIVMAVIGVVVGTIVILLYMPIFELAGTLQ